jgi:hypothetical protein
MSDLESDDETQIQLLEPIQPEESGKRGKVEAYRSFKLHGEIYRIDDAIKIQNISNPSKSLLVKIESIKMKVNMPLIEGRFLYPAYQEQVSRQKKVLYREHFRMHPYEVLYSNLSTIIDPLAIEGSIQVWNLDDFKSKFPKLFAQRANVSSKSLQNVFCYRAASSRSLSLWEEFTWDHYVKNVEFKVGAAKLVIERKPNLSTPSKSQPPSASNTPRESRARKRSETPSKTPSRTPGKTPGKTKIDRIKEESQKTPSSRTKSNVSLEEDLEFEFSTPALKDRAKKSISRKRLPKDDSDDESTQVEIGTPSKKGGNSSTRKSPRLSKTDTPTKQSKRPQATSAKRSSLKETPTKPVEYVTSISKRNRVVRTRKLENGLDSDSEGTNASNDDDFKVARIESESDEATNSAVESESDFDEVSNRTLKLKKTPMIRNLKFKVRRSPKKYILT